METNTDTQVKMIEEILLDGGSVTRLSAILSLGIANLTARISEIRQRGIVPVKTEMVTNERGKRYARYSRG